MGRTAARQWPASRIARAPAAPQRTPRPGPDEGPPPDRPASPAAVLGLAGVVPHLADDHQRDDRAAGRLGGPRPDPGRHLRHLAGGVVVDLSLRPARPEADALRAGPLADGVRRLAGPV